MASKKNLVILLVMPFAISLLSFNVINMTFHLIDNDILGIEWDYQDNELFRLSAANYELKAQPLNDKNYPVDQPLIWSVTNIDGEEESHAEIIVSNDKSYLHTLSVGEVSISVSNSKGNVSKKMNATIYEKNAIVMNNLIRGSQSNVDDTIYYGEFDYKNGISQRSKIEYNLTAITEFGEAKTVVKAKSDNIYVDHTNQVINFNGSGDAFVTFGFEDSSYPDTSTYKFKIVKDGYNVYNYSDLMYCTNKSPHGGDIVVLRKNLESYASVYPDGQRTKDSTMELFGTYSDGKFLFNDDVYRFETKFNKEFINQWNNNQSLRDKGYPTVSKDIVAGIRVRKDFYGNGFTINLHNLAYPYSSIVGTNPDTGETYMVPVLTKDNLFRGPLPYYTLGDPTNMPLVTAYGQDNIGMYIDGNDITINDLVIKNCDFGNVMSNLDYVGTVMEVSGDNVTIKNSRLSNGKNVFKSYDSNNVLLDNCMLSYSRNFLVMTGSYQYLSVKKNQGYQFVLEEDGRKQTINIDEYLGRGGLGDVTLENYLRGMGNKEYMEDALRSIQSALDNSINKSNKGSLEIRDTLFYRSGISSIALESLFNGAFLYNNSPSVILDTFSKAEEMAGVSNLIPLLADNVGGVSYPVSLTLSGKTKFYEYKTTADLDINGLIGQGFSALIESFLGPDSDFNFDLDMIFPVKSMLGEIASNNHYYYNGSIGVPIAFYGGGLNLSQVNFSDDFEYKEHMSDIYNLDFLKRYLSMETTGDGSIMSDPLGFALKCVTAVSGFNPFKFALSNGDGYLYGLAPQVSDLVNNKK